MKPGPAISTRLKCVSSKAGIAAATASAILRGGIPNTRAPAMAKLEARSPFFTSFGTSTTKAGSSFSGRLPSAIAARAAVSSSPRASSIAACFGSKCLKSCIFSKLLSL